jgi:hypothetical protein
MDILEDTAEFHGQFLSSLEHDVQSIVSAVVIIPDQVPVLFCDVCRAIVYSREGLEDHVRRFHWRQHVYLRVNGSIVRDDLWIEKNIESCELVLLGIDSAEVTVCTGSEKYKGIFRNGKRFESLFPSDFEGEAVFEISVPGGLGRLIHLYCRRLPEFDQALLDRLIGKFQKEFDSTLKRPDLSDWRAATTPDIGKMERRYVDGFFEYTLGSYLEITAGSREAKSHLEDAFGLLFPFKTPLALRAKWILSFKMNAFGVLAGCPDGSVFQMAYAFFINRHAYQWEPKSPPAKKGSYDLYIDGFSSEYLAALAAYFEDDDNLIDRRLGALSAHPLFADRNNEDKYHLLAARVAARRGRIDEARQQYEILRFHPLFGKEAEEFSHVNRQ